MAWFRRSISSAFRRSSYVVATANSFWFVGSKHQRAPHQSSSKAEQRLNAEKQIKGCQEQLATAAKGKTALGKQLEAERKSRLHILSDFEGERKQRENLIKQLEEAEQRLGQSPRMEKMEKAVATTTVGAAPEGGGGDRSSA